MTAPSQLFIHNLRAAIGGKPILHDVSLDIRPGEIHAIMGPNGSGKSTLCHALMGDPAYETGGSARLDGQELVGLDIDARARAGLFLSYQSPPAVPGVSLANYLRTIYNAAREGETPISIAEFERIAREEMAALGMDESFLDRYLNDGFSGGERKRCETLQLALLRPKYVLLDEIDSGLDVDALRVISKDLLRLQARYRFGILIITHYTRILRYLKPGQVHLLHAGRITQSGGPELAERIEREGYEGLLGADEAREPTGQDAKKALMPKTAGRKRA